MNRVNPQRSVHFNTTTVMDTGTNRTIFTQDCISQHPESVTKTVPRGHHTRRFVYCNGTEFQSEDAVELGDYTAHIAPASHAINLISVNDICVKGGHVVLFTPTSVIIRDIGTRYEVRYPKLISEDDWLVPPDVLNILSDLRARHPLSIALRNLIPTTTIGFESIQPLQQQSADTSVAPSSPSKRRRSRQYSGRHHNSDPSTREKPKPEQSTPAETSELRPLAEPTNTDPEESYKNQLTEDSKLRP
eukprot:gene39689-52359_t